MAKFGKSEEKKKPNSLLEASKLNVETPAEVPAEVAPVAVETKVETPSFQPQYKQNAYSLIENNGAYHVIAVEFDAVNMVAGKVKKIESNTEKFLMQERLQVLLMGDDLV